MTTTLADILLRPIPDQTVAFGRKKDYRDYPILKHMHDDEPLVDIALYGLPGQSYYSRPNSATGDPIPDVKPVIQIRKSLAERLANINYTLQASEEAAALFGGSVELYIDEGLRTPEMQRELYERVFPAHIRRQFPDASEEEILERRDGLIARPSDDRSPSPHATGAVVDIKLRFANQELGYMPKSFIQMRAQPGSMDDTARADYFERKSVLTAKEETMSRNRRAFYWVMRGALTGDDSGLVCNPSEYWHWAYGDQMWAALTEAPCAFFDAVQI
jgi:D-alanyl-D-alanine dipeptidase